MDWHMRVESLGLFNESCITARVFVEDLKTQTTSLVGAFWKSAITRNQNPTIGASLQYSFTLLYLHLLATMPTLELHYKNLKVYQTLILVLVLRVTLSAAEKKNNHETGLCSLF